MGVDFEGGERGVGDRRIVRSATNASRMIANGVRRDVGCKIPVECAGKGISLIRHGGVSAASFKSNFDVVAKSLSPPRRIQPSLQLARNDGMEELDRVCLPLLIDCCREEVRARPLWMV